MDTNTPMTNMTPAEMRDFGDRMEYSSAAKEHSDKEAALKAHVAAATEVSLRGNQQYQLLQSGQLSQRASVQNGQMTIENLRATGQGRSFTAPQALIDTIPVTVGGIQLGPKQAQEMLVRREISEDDYWSGLSAALAPYGYSSPSFR